MGELSWLGWGGIGVQIIGLLVGAFGIRATWVEHCKPGEQMWPSIHRARAVVVRSTFRLLRVLGIHRSVTVNIGASAASVSVASFAARGRIVFGPLADVAAEPEAFAEQVRQRIDRVGTAQGMVDH